MADRFYNQPAARAEQLYRDEMELHNVPAHLRDGLIRYLLGRIRPGGFLCAVLADDAPEAFRRAAPDITVAGMAGLHLFLMGVAPANAWGSYEAIERWLDHDASGQPRPADAHLGAVIECGLHGGER